MQPQKPRGPAPIDELIRSFLREQGLGASGNHARVFNAWRDVLEPGLRQHAEPVRFRAGELVIEVDSAAHLQEMKNFTGESYRKRANERLGKQAIRRIVFKLRG